MSDVALVEGIPKKPEWWVHPHLAPPPADFRIVVDTREQTPLFRPEGHPHVPGPPFHAWAVPGTLGEGDYSLQGFTDLVRIERKSLSDLFGSCGSSRERFEREYVRLTSIPTRILLIEANYRSVVDPDPREYSGRMNPTSVEGTILGWWNDYGVFPVFATDHRYAARWTFRYLALWFQRHGEEL